MSELRKSPLRHSTEEPVTIELRDRDVIDVNLLQQKITLVSKEKVILNFNDLLPDDACEERKSAVYRIAKATNESIKDNKSQDSEYAIFIMFASYCRFCDRKNLNPFSKKGYLAYLGRKGELARLIEIANKPFDYLYLYNNEAEIGIRETTAAIARSYITMTLNRIRSFDLTWERDTPSFSAVNKPTAAYSQSEYSTLLRRLQFVFYSIASQLIAAKEKNEEIYSVQAVLDEFENGEIHVIELINCKPRVGSINALSPFNVAMSLGLFLFSHYTNLNKSSMIHISHPLTESEHKKEHRTTRYIIINAWKGRANKVVQGVFAEETECDFVQLEVDKRDGLSFITTLEKLSRLFNPEFEDSNHPHLFFHLTHKGEVGILKNAGVNNATALLTCYRENKHVHTSYLIERFNQVLDKGSITTVCTKENGSRQVIKETKQLPPASRKSWAIKLAYAVLRSLTDIQLKSIYMPLAYSEIDTDGKVSVTFLYQNGSRGEFPIDSCHVKFFKKLERYAEYYNPVNRSKHSPNAKRTPYLLPLGPKYSTYQWDGAELPIGSFLNKIGIYSGDYLLDINTKRFRATGSSNDFDPTDKGLSVATSLLQNSLSTLHDHYLNGNVVQNQVIASQAIETLQEFSKGKSLESAKEKVKETRSIEVLEYDDWKELRMPTNPNGLLCTGEPTGKAKKEHQASSNRAKAIMGDEVNVKCYQYDDCVTCKSAKLVNDVESAYKLLSFIELLEDSVELMPEREMELTERAYYLMSVAETNLSETIFKQAEDKLSTEGRYLLHNDNFLHSMMGVNYNA
jgi:hypothetical protein